MNPYYVIGLIDAEGCFYINRNSKYNRVSFNITNKNKDILYMLQKYFHAGYVYEDCHGNGTVSEWRIQSKKDLKILVEFIEKHGPQCSDEHNPLFVKMENRPRHKNKVTTWEEWSKMAKNYYNKPVKYTDEKKLWYIKMTKKLKPTGLTYKEIAEKLNINLSTLQNWRRKFDESYQCQTK